MITRVQVKNYRSLADVDVELGPLTVLVGRNGTGKSTFLDVLRFVRDSIRLGLDTAIAQRGGIGAIRRWSAKGRPYDVEITIWVATPEMEGHYFFIIGGKQGEYKVKREECSVTTYGLIGRDDPFTDRYEVVNGKWVTYPEEALFSGTPGPREFRRTRLDALLTQDRLALSTVMLVSEAIAMMQSALRRTNFYSIFPNTLREPQKPTNEETLLEHGENLATVLRHLKRDKERHTQLVSALGRVVDGVNDIRVRQVGGYLVTELKHQVSSGGSPWFELSQESDGTLRILSLLVALFQVDYPWPTLTAIEEPELTIHPGALAILSDVLHEAAQQMPMLITTQSPDLISRFRADELRVAERVNGQTRIGPVDERQREIINEQLFSAGDLLRIEGLHLEETAEAAA